MKPTLTTILAILSLFCYVNGSYPSMSSVKEYDELLHQMIHMIQKVDGVIQNPETYSTIREIRQSSQVAFQGHAYIESDINSCSLPSSTIGNFCGISERSPTLMVKRQSKAMEFIISRFSTLQATLGSTCSNTLKVIMCNGGYPQCSSDSSIATYKNFASGCSRLSSCTAGAINLNGLSGSQLCRSSGKSIQLTTCAKFSMNSISSTYCGSLPYNITFPTWILPGMSNLDLTISNLKTTLDRTGVSSSCTRKWMRLSCRDIPFCSSDRTKLLGVITRQDCESALNCLSGTYETILRQAIDCNMFPDQNGRKYPVPPGHGYTSRAWPVAIGSFLLYAICSFLYYML